MLCERIRRVVVIPSFYFFCSMSIVEGAPWGAPSITALRLINAELDLYVDKYIVK